MSELIRPNARRLLAWSGGYHAICREERNIAAIFYHLLLHGSNLQRFLDLVGCTLRVEPSEVSIYFEYAYLRDLWSERVTDPAVARALILELLRPPNADDLRAMSIEDFNRHFGAVPVASREHIQMPEKWSIERFARRIPDDDAFLRTCRFKWAFNAKPDIVIHTSHDAALCVEATVASAEGQYPTKPAEIAEFGRRGIATQGQTDLQAYILRELLGIDADFVFLVASEPTRSATHRTITWAEAFAALDTTGSPPFIRTWIARICAAP